MAKENNIQWNLEDDMSSDSNQFTNDQNPDDLDNPWGTEENSPVNWDNQNIDNAQNTNDVQNENNEWEFNSEPELKEEWTFDTRVDTALPTDNEQSLEQPDLGTNETDRKHTRLGMVQNVNIRPTLWKLNYDNSKILEEINSANLEPLGKGPAGKANEDGIFKLETGPGTALSELLEGIQDIAKRQMKELSNVFIYKNGPRESTLNLFTGNPKNNFIYFVEGDFNTGDVVIDFSSLKGPTNRITESTPGIFIELEGWVPFRITKNLSDKNLVAIGGSFN